MASEKIESSEAQLSSSPIEFFHESIAELKKVHSPTKAETIQATLVTLFIMFFVAVTLFFLDMIFKGLMHALLS